MDKSNDTIWIDEIVNSFDSSVTDSFKEWVIQNLKNEFNNLNMKLSMIDQKEVFNQMDGWIQQANEGLLEIIGTPHIYCEKNSLRFRSRIKFYKSFKRRITNKLHPQTGYKWKKSKVELIELHRLLLKDSLIQDTSLENFTNCFKPYTANNGLKWNTSNKLLSYLIAALFESGFIAEKWKVTEFVFKLKNMKQSYDDTKNALPKGHKKIDEIILQLSLNH